MTDVSPHRHRTHLYRGMFVAVLVIAGVLAPGKAHAVACQTVNSNFTLNSDINNCADNGIEITKSGITLNLNGHTIDGDDDADDVGILIDDFDEVTIRGPGTIREFGTGIRINDGNANRITGVTVTENNDTSTGILVTPTDPADGAKTSGNIIENSTITLNAGTGIVIYRGSSGTKIINNDVDNNGGDGIFLGGAGEGSDFDGNGYDERTVKVSRAKVNENDVTNNVGTGIALVTEGGSRNVFANNTSIDNGTDTTFPAGGHETRAGGDLGGHGLKVAGGCPDTDGDCEPVVRLQRTRIVNNTITGNGTPPSATLPFQRNGAGVFVAGDMASTTINGNTLQDNAMAGIAVVGEHRGLNIKNNPDVSANQVNGEDDEAGIFMSGPMRTIIVSGNNVHDNAASGIFFEGHSKGLRILDNIASNNVGTGTEGQDNTAGIAMIGRALNLQIVDNTVNNNSNTGAACGEDEGPLAPCVGNGIRVQGSLRKTGDIKQAALVKNNTTNDNEGFGIGVFAEGSKPQDNTDPMDDNRSQTDLTFNKTNTAKLTGNTANNNDADGIFLITDVTLANNVANNNADDGIEHEPNPTVNPRNADASDGPHIVKNNGGNTATGNTDQGCVGITC